MGFAIKIKGELLVPYIVEALKRQTLYNKEVLSFTKSVYSIKKDKLRRSYRASFLVRDTGMLFMRIAEIQSHPRKWGPKKNMS